MFKMYFLFFYFLSTLASAVELQLLASKTFPHKLKFDKTIIGGLSGLWYDSPTNTLYSVSDDKGEFNEPRYYQFSLKYKADSVDLEPQKVIFLKQKVRHFLDLEAIAILPWGNFLISSEGNNNLKPRVPPEIMDVKKDGTVVRSFEIPEHFLPEPSGEQKKGIQNNRGFEGVTTSPSGKFIWIMNEAPLVQDSKENFVRMVQYEMPEAWIIKPTKEFKYRPEVNPHAVGTGVSEMLALNDNQILVMERGVAFDKKGVTYFVQIYLFDIKTLKKSLVLDFEKIKARIGNEIQNFEGMSFGPEIDKKKTILVISDDNFNKAEKTQLLLFSMKE